MHQRVKRLEQRGLILGYGATVNHDEIGLPLTAFISIRPIDPSQPDDSPERLRDIPEIESCWSVAGDESYILKVRRRPGPATSRTCSPGSAQPPTSRRAPRSCCRRYYENRPVTGARLAERRSAVPRRSTVSEPTVGLSRAGSVRLQGRRTRDASATSSASSADSSPCVLAHHAWPVGQGVDRVVVLVGPGQRLGVEASIDVR